jgi:hypothetical protein
MKNFIEPINGTKIAEYKMSWFKHFIYVWINEPFYYIAQIIFRIGLLILLPLKYGIKFMNIPFNPLWLSWTIGITLCLIAGALAFVQIGYGWVFRDNRKQNN